MNNCKIVIMMKSQNESVWMVSFRGIIHVYYIRRLLDVYREKCNFLQYNQINL